MNRPIVLDSSALLAALYDEPGGARVRAEVVGASMSTVNLAEVFSKLRERNLETEETEAMIRPIPVVFHAFDAAYARAAGHLRPLTRELGLSLGDRACLALAIKLGATALTADRAWSGIPIDVLAGARVEVVR